MGEWATPCIIMMIFYFWESKYKYKILLNEFNKVCQFIGVPIPHEKTEGPVNKLTCLGLEIDTVHQAVGIPVSQLNELKDKLNNAMSR
jgi:hypothetical protein